MGAKKAAVAVAHKILVIAFHMQQRVVAFADLGADDLDRGDKHRSPSARPGASTRSVMPSCSASGPPIEPAMYISTADPAHLREFSGQPAMIASTTANGFEWLQLSRWGKAASNLAGI